MRTRPNPIVQVAVVLACVPVLAVASVVHLTAEAWKGRRFAILSLLLAGTSGCVSFGVECRSGETHGWVKVRRIAFAPSKATTENLTGFKEKVCR